MELTWTNKDKRLLSHDDGSYEWVGPGDFRVNEVRLLRRVERVGDETGSDNLLIHGDALNALTSLARLPEYASRYVGKIRLAYLDPPFNTQQAFEHYDDALEHSVWLTMMRDRLAQVRDLLAPDGSIYVHCDASEGHYLKMVLDEVFGRDNFRTEIVWKRTTAHSDSKTWSRVTDSVFFYTRSSTFVWNAPYLGHDDEYVRAKYTHTDPDGRRYQLDNLTSPHPRPNLTYEWRGYEPPAFGWRYSKDTMAQLDSEGRIWYPEDKSRRPRLKRYLDESRGRLADNVWTDIPPVNSQAREDTRYDTQKPEQLIQRIVGASSNQGDVVLDCFLGSGTTAAVAHKMGRRWVGVEWSKATVDQFALPRLRAVLGGTDVGGITKDVGWQGGGSFEVVEVAPSMFSAQEGVVTLADWATGGALAEATAAQLGFTFKADPPFSGTKGRTRLAVVDGLVNEDAIRLLLQALAPEERLAVYATAFDPAARETLRGLRAGSTLRKIPSALLETYRGQPAAVWQQARIPI